MSSRPLNANDDDDNDNVDDDQDDDDQDDYTLLFSFFSVLQGKYQTE